MLKKNFYRRFVYYSCLITLPLTLIFLAFILKVSVDMKTDIEKKTQSSLYTIRDSYDLILDNAMVQYDNLTRNPRLAIAVKKMLAHNSFTYTDVLLTNNVMQNFSTMVNYTPYLTSVYYYMDNNENFLTSTDGIQSIHTYPDKSWLDSYENSDKNTWIERRTIKFFSYANSYPVVTLYKRLTMFDGVLALNINPERFQETLNYQQSVNSEYLYIVDSKGNLLFNSSQGKRFYETCKDHLSPLILEPEEAEYQKSWVTIDGEKYLISRLSGKYGTVLISCVSRQSLFSKLYHNMGLFSIVICLVIGSSLWLAYDITTQNFKQIDYMVQLFADAEKGIYHIKKPKDLRDEYHVILNNIIQIFLKSTVIKNQLALKEEKQKLAEFAALQLQINPHFLFNTLQTLDFKALEQEKDSTAMHEIITDLSDILKYSLENPKRMVSLSDELDHLRKYDRIQHVRYEDKYILYLEYEDELLSHPFMRLLLQPLVENSLYHGIKPLDGTGYIKLKIHSRHGKIQVAVIDTGVGMTKEEIENLYSRINDSADQNIGLTNVNLRLILQYGEDSRLHIQSKPGVGTCISFQLPIDSCFQEFSKNPETDQASEPF